MTGSDAALLALAVVYLTGCAATSKYMRQNRDRITTQAPAVGAAEWWAAYVVCVIAWPIGMLHASIYGFWRGSL